MNNVAWENIMNKSTRLKALLLKIFCAILVTGGLATTLWSADSNSDGQPVPSKTNSVSSAARQPDANKISPKRQLSGAELYSMHCNRCHPERYPTERTAAQWKTIMLHMRVRANLPADQARTILKYLQDNSGR
jgi:hypothetical protein